jgi:hypothetical protein
MKRGEPMVETPKDFEKKLTKMKLSELKDFAKERNINSSKCKSKKDYISAILGEIELGVMYTLSAEEAQKSEGEPQENPITEEENAQLNETLNSVKDETAELSALNDLLTKMEPAFESDNCADLLGYIDEAISTGYSNFKKFQGIGLSLAILSSQRMIDSIKALDLSVDEAEKLLTQTKRHFLDDMYVEASEVVNKLRDLTPALQEKQRKRLSKMIRAVESTTASAGKIGANVRQAQNLLKEAKAHFDEDRFIECAEFVMKARDAIVKTKTEREALIEEAIDFVEELIQNAKGIGADVAAPSKHLAKAKSLFENRDFQMCMYTTIQAEEITTDLIRQQVDRALALQKSLEDRFRAVATSPMYQQMKSRGPQAEAGGVVSGEKEAVEEEQEGKEETEKEEKKYPCQTCGNSLDYIEQYKRWYCYTCGKYV